MEFLMSVLSNSNIVELEKNCKLILEKDEIIFIGVINVLGNLVSGGFKKGMMPSGFEVLQKSMYMQCKIIMI